MFVPKAFRLDDRQQIAAVIEANNFGLLVTAAAGAPETRPAASSKAVPTPSFQGYVPGRDTPK